MTITALFRNVFFPQPSIVHAKGPLLNDILLDHMSHATICNYGLWMKLKVDVIKHVIINSNYEYEAVYRIL